MQTISRLPNFMRPVTHIGTALFASVFLAFGANAQTPQAQPEQAPDPVSQPGVPLLNFDAQNLGPLLTEMKYLWQERQSADGKRFMLVNADGEVVFILSPLACRKDGVTDCVGLQTIAVFEGRADRAFVEEFNARYAFANIGINDQGNAYLNRYDIADYGIARGNIATLIRTFVDLSKIYSSLASNAGQSVSFQGDVPSDEGTLDFLNTIAHTLTAKGRDQEVDRIVEISNNSTRFFKDEALPNNKIRNIGE